MKIVQLVTKRQFRGAEVFAAELSSMLGKRGHTVWFAGLYKCTENFLDAKNAINIDLNGTKSSFISISLLKDLVKFLKETKPDIVQANGSDNLKYAVLAKLFIPHLRVVYRNISMVSSWTKSNGFKKKFNKWLFTKVDRVSSVGQESLNDLVHSYQYPVEKTAMIRRGVPVYQYDKAETRKKLSAEFAINENDPLVIHVGQFSPEKNHGFLIESFEQVLAVIPTAKLLFIGEGNGFEQVKKIVDDKQLEHNIFFAGYRENVQELISTADLFVLGSTIEGLPGVVIEAAMQSIPTVAVSVGGVGEVVLNGKTGVLLNKHDVVQFGQAIIQCLQNPEERILMGKQAKQFAETNFSLQQCVENFERFYIDTMNCK